MKDTQLGSFRRQSRVPLDPLLLRDRKGADGLGSHHELRMINQLATQVFESLAAVCGLAFAACLRHTYSMANMQGSVHAHNP